ncbi:MAG TPA: EamA family transporter [Steroidobacteraceae bacterium]|nr:EamA family transporter [Steroidobacteraceae bacterium]
MRSTGDSRFHAPGLAVLASLVCVTLGASLAKGLFPLVGPIGTTTLRLCLAALILLIVMRSWRIRPGAAAWRAALAYGLVMAGMNMMFYLAIERIPLGIAIALEFTGPLTVAVLHSRHRRDLLWVACAILGLVLLIPRPVPGQAVALGGAAFALGAGVLWGAYILVGQRAGAALGSQGAAFGLMIAALLVLPAGLLLEPRLHPAAWTALPLLPLLSTALAVALLSSALPYTLEMYALRHIPARSFGILMSGEPAIGALMGLMMLGERLSIAQWLGIAAVVTASLGTTLADPRADPQPQT